MRDIPKIPMLMILLGGEILASASVVFIRLSSIDPILLASFRMLVAVVFLLPFYFRELKRDHKDVVPFSPAEIKPVLVPGLLLGIHFITWIYGARLVPAANASLIVNLTPVATPFFIYFSAKERVNFLEVLGSLIAILGCFLLARGDFSMDRQYFLGDLVIFSAMLTFALYQVYAKKRMTGLWRYMVPLYLVGGLFCLIVAIFTGASFLNWTAHDVIAIFGLSLLSTIGGHSIFNLAMKHLRGQIVSVFHTTQFIYAGIMAFFILREVPGRSFLLVAPIILTGLFITISGQWKIPGRKRPEKETSHVK
ncbi:DMT family transporter [Spirochaeta isovalerica]|uniref:Drug/metabolite transporter (DMT)-like permease n=1 Tax=Spirochaeta isovalerica TaxID=150 RepID=A0A841RFY3_9SPIO|nr:DMT family transporter [Spirochaeta isovalerica]MBB6482127.1 drug/metabolite transporter (DMT)-like permease [Spirochaeta isovalerica]